MRYIYDFVGGKDFRRKIEMYHTPPPPKTKYKQSINKQVNHPVVTKKLRLLIRWTAARRSAHNKKGFFHCIDLLLFSVSNRLISHDTDLSSHLSFVFWRIFFQANLSMETFFWILAQFGRQSTTGMRNSNVQWFKQLGIKNYNAYGRPVLHFIRIQRILAAVYFSSSSVNAQKNITFNETHRFVSVVTTRH